MAEGYKGKQFQIVKIKNNYSYSSFNLSLETRLYRPARWLLCIGGFRVRSPCIKSIYSSATGYFLHSTLPRLCQLLPMVGSRCPQSCGQETSCRLAGLGSSLQGIIDIIFPTHHTWSPAGTGQQGKGRTGVL